MRVVGKGFDSPLPGAVLVVLDDVNATICQRQAVNTTMAQAYWQIGRLTVEDEQGGSARAEYGKAVLRDLSRRLSAEFGKGFTPDNLRNFRQFFQCFTRVEICDTVCRELSWSHFRLLMREIRLYPPSILRKQLQIE